MKGTNAASGTAVSAAAASTTPSVPPWLTPQLLTAALREEDEACEQVTTIRVRPAVISNENYLSELFRVHAHIGKSEVRRLIVKAMPSSEVTSSMVTACGFFTRETRMLMDTVPRLERQLASGLSHRPKDQLQIGPNAIAKCTNGALLMEDLAARGYSNVPRQEGLDLPHSLVAVRLLARMHAASVMLHALSPEHARSLEAYGTGWMSNEMSAATEQLITSSLQTLATVARTWPRLGEAVAEQLERAAGGAMQRATQCSATKKGEFTVLNHGDAWSNNIMFSYDEDTAQVRSALLIDFQMASWGSPALDLHYFMSLAASPRVRRESSARVVRAYHAELSTCLAAMNYQEEPPKLAVIQRDMRNHEYWSLFSSVCLLPIRYVESGLAMDSTVMLTKDSPIVIKTFNAPACRAELEELVQQFIAKGFLN